MANNSIAALKAELSAASAEMQLMDNESRADQIKAVYEAKLLEKEGEMYAVKAELNALKAGGLGPPMATPDGHSPFESAPLPAAPPPAPAPAADTAPLPAAAPPQAPLPAASPAAAEVDSTEAELEALLREVEQLREVVEPEPGSPEAVAKVGLYTLNPVDDPWLTTTWFHSTLAPEM
jgi:hypothetical protein